MPRSAASGSVALRTRRDWRKGVLVIAMRRKSSARRFVTMLVSALSLALLFGASAASDAQAAVSICNVPIEMSDGVVLSANIFLPSTTGHYPTILTATGYNKDAANPGGQDCEASQGIAGDEPGLTEK